MRTSVFLISLLLHLSVFALALYAPWGKGKPSIDLNKPVYEVDLVQLPKKEKPSESVAGDISQKKDSSEKKERTKKKKKQAIKKKKPPAKKSPAKPEAVKVAKKSPAKPKAEKRKKKEIKKKPRVEKSRAEKPSQAPTKDQVLAKALGEVKNSLTREEKSDQDIIEQELKALRGSLDSRKNKGQEQSGTKLTERLYAGLIEGRIKENWRFPQISNQLQLQAEVKIALDSQGRISKVNLIKSSGRDDFDRSILKAVEETKKLPPPPRNDLKTITITFNLQEKQG